MRYNTSHKDITKQKIIDVASRLFKVNGTDATGIAMVMKEAGLTNGAFYSHFVSKENLVEAVISDQLQKQLEIFKEQLENKGGLETIIKQYLSQEHLKSCADGCPSAALLGDISRRTFLTRQVYTDGLGSITSEIANNIKNGSIDKKQFTLALFGLLVGTLQLARTVTDENLANDILKGGRETALSLASNT
ncbi:MAG: TetR/AcrR family transcriptional regulator [Candidatus Microsaccharimonas sp.]